MPRISLAGLWSALLASLLVAALTGCAGRPAGYEPFEIAGWHEAAAVRVASSGEWVCYVSAPYKSGITLGIWRSGKGYRLEFEKAGWSLEEGAVYPVHLSIDDLWAARRQGVAVENAIVIPLLLDADALGALRRGSVLTMVAQAETFRFELRGEAATLDRLESCYRRHLPKDATGYRNPFPAAQNPFKAHPRSEATSRTPTIMKPANLEQILQQATGLSFRADQASEFTPSADLVYLLDDYLFGYYWEESVEGRNLDTVLALTLAGMQTDCAGRAVSGRHPGRENDIAKIRRGFVSCEESDFFADILILSRGGFAMVFVTSSSLGDAELAEGVGAAVAQGSMP